jgi:GTPase SAR1 family protein
MNNSISTVTGKIKIKIVFLGNQSVGKSSIIDKYVNDKFEETAHVTLHSFSPQSASTFSPKIYYTRQRTTDYSSGTQQGRKDSSPSFQVISGTHIAL